MALAHVHAIHGLSERAHLYTQTLLYVRPHFLTYSLRSRQSRLLPTPFLQSNRTKIGEDMNSNEVSSARVHTMPELERLIVDRVLLADDRIKAGVTLPAGHSWWASDCRLKFSGSPVRSTACGASLFVRRDAIEGRSPDDLLSDKTTIRAEIRLFMPEALYLEGGTVRRYRRHSGKKYSATLWVNTGPHWAFQSTSHLRDKEPFVYGDTLGEICAGIIERVNIALARAALWISAQESGMVEAVCA